MQEFGAANTSPVLLAVVSGVAGNVCTEEVS